MAKSKYIEALEEQYTKKDAKSVLRYKAPDNKWRYVQTSKDASGGNMPSGGGITEVTWQELKDKRDNGELNPGALYRITDYNCTTTQENTQSAGHQFDIVLLALSTNKLAEEGWAMMHDNIYDVTFSDGVTKKCYIYNRHTIDYDPLYNLVDCNTLLGISDCPTDELEVNEENKTAIAVYDSFLLDEANLTYNYFQNSNLSAWKVWYCLDNDKSRFAWAEEDIPTFICNINVPSAGYSLENVRVIRDYGADYDGRYAYVVINGDTVTNIATDRELKDSGDYTIYLSVHLSANAHVEILSSSVTRNGRGVIYRLIDEFNNDIKYDFKNIQFKRKITNGQYNANGTDTWCYTLNIWYNDMCQDASIVGNTMPNDEGYISGVYGNKFGYATAYDLNIDGVNTFAFALGNNVVLSFDNGGEYCGIYSNTIGNNFYSNTIGNNFYSNTIGNNFYSNTIGEYFSYNIIGNNFFDKTISDNTGYKNYGNNGVELATKDDLN